MTFNHPIIIDILIISSNAKKINNNDEKNIKYVLKYQLICERLKSKQKLERRWITEKNKAGFS
jgi:hypothetical protein